LSITNGDGNSVGTTHIGKLNSLRYRGYCGDTETQWYYLQSRYYDPVTHRFINADSFASTGQGALGFNMFSYCRNNPIMRTDACGAKDYIFTGQEDYYTENDWGWAEFLHIDGYYIESNGKRYRANSQETANLHSWSSVDEDFLNTTFIDIIDTANLKSCSLSRIFNESVGGELDFKLQLPQEMLFLADGIVYNRNELGNFIWAYYLESNGYGAYVSGLLAQGGSLFPGLSKMDGTARFDESWDVAARYRGIFYRYKNLFSTQ